MPASTDRRSLLLGGVATVAATVTSSAIAGPAAASTARGGSLRTRADAPDGHTAPFGTVFAQRELVLDIRDLYQDEDGTTTFPGTEARVRDHSRALHRAVELASASDALATIAFPAGTFVVEPITLDRPIRLVGVGSPTARYGQPVAGGRVWGGAMLVRSSSAPPGPLLTVHSHGVTIEGISFDGRGTTEVGLHVTNGFELRVIRSRLINFQATALLVDHANNAVFDTVHVNNAGVPGGASAVVVNSTPADDGSMPNGTRTNTLDFRSLTIEQSRATALEIGVDPAKNRADRDQHPEYLRFTDLHVESTSHGGQEQEFLPAEPALRIGVLYSATFVAPFVYGGPGPVLSQDAGSGPAARSTGVTLVGGVLRGQRGAAQQTPALIDLRKGDEFRVLGTRFTQYTRSPVVIQSTFGASVQIDPTCMVGAAPGSPAGTPRIDDLRDSSKAAPFRVVGRLHTDDVVELHGGIEGHATPVRVDTAGINVAAVEADRTCDEVRGRVVFRTSSTPAAGAQVKIHLPRVGQYRVSAAAHVTASDAACARLLPFAQLRSDTGSNELWLCLSSTPAPDTRYGFYYSVIG